MKPEVASRFREGWIMLFRPFEFAELDYPLQKLTVVYAFSEEPKYEYEGNPKFLELQRSYWENERKYAFEDEDAYERRTEIDLNAALKVHPPIKKYIGEIVQVSLRATEVRLFPDEYKILEDQNLTDLLEEDSGYTSHVVFPEMLKQNHVQNLIFYCLQRGISKETSIKMASISLKHAVFLKPRREILEMFCRPYEIIPENAEERIEYAKNLEFSRPPLIPLK
jgi:hypothetical protein